MRRMPIKAQIYKYINTVSGVRGAKKENKQDEGPESMYVLGEGLRC